MATKPKSTPKVYPHDIQVPASPKAMPPGAQHRRSVPKGAERTAQVLVHQAGSVSKAKKAIDTAVELERCHEFREDQLATRLGFRSRQELMKASKPVVDAVGESWWATRTADGHWVVWNDETVKGPTYATLQEAKRSLGPQQNVSETSAGTAFPEGFNG